MLLFPGPKSGSQFGHFFHPSASRWRPKMEIFLVIGLVEDERKQPWSIGALSIFRTKFQNERAMHAYQSFQIHNTNYATCCIMGQIVSPILDVVRSSKMLRYDYFRLFITIRRGCTRLLSDVSVSSMCWCSIVACKIQRCHNFFQVCCIKLVIILKFDIHFNFAETTSQRFMYSSSSLHINQS